MKNPSLKLSWSVTDAYSGQVNECCHAMLDGHEVGRLQISTFRDEPSIDWIEVYEGAKRKGIATAMVRDLQSRFPETEIKWSSTLPDGEALKKSLSYRVVVDEAVVAMQKELSECLASRGDFENLSAAFDSIDSPSQSQVEERQKWFFENGPKWDEIHDRIWELERDLRDGPTGEKRIVLSSDDVLTMSLANNARDVAQSASALSVGVRP